MKKLDDVKEDTRLEALHALQILDTPIEERFERITRLASSAFRVPVSAISCIDHERIWFKSSQGINASQAKRSDSFCQHTIYQREPMVINDARLDSVFADLPVVAGGPKYVFYAGAPIFSPEGEQIAAMCIMDTEPRSLDEQELNMLIDFASLTEHELYAKAPNEVVDQLINQVGGAWRQSLIDPLTRLWNHEGIITISIESLINANASNEGMCFVLLDIARFQSINDKLGHVGGDEVLKIFAGDLLQKIRKHDAIGRIRNDEFLLVMNSISEQKQAQGAINRLGSMIESFAVEGADENDDFHVSMAVVRVPPKWNGILDTVLEQLDEAMFTAKNSTDRLPVMVDARANKQANQPGDEQAA